MFHICSNRAIKSRATFRPLRGRGEMRPYIRRVPIDKLPLPDPSNAPKSKAGIAQPE